MVFIELTRRFIVHFMIFEFSFLCLCISLFCCAFPVSDFFFFFFARSIGIGYSDSRIRIRRVWISSGLYVCQTGSGKESLSIGLVG